MGGGEWQMKFGRLKDLTIKKLVIYPYDNLKRLELISNLVFYRNHIKIKRLLMSKILCTLSFVFLTNLALACTCIFRENLKKAQKDNFEESNIVFIGKIASIDTLKWEFEIEPLEVFKGTVMNQNFKSQLSSCSIFPKQVGDIWLIYSNQEDQDLLYISQCGLSRSFDDPFTMSSGSSSPPPPPIQKNDLINSTLTIELNLSKAKIKATKTLRKEILVLRRLSIRQSQSKNTSNKPSA
ncbi:hypothetical protein B0E43_03620 [Algoriphagus sp. A40]|nr:hypothetical protein B0E43_03620 [Algoriphagus sp. A40]